MFGYTEIILLSIDLVDDDLQILDEIPFIGAFGLREEVEEDYIVELEAFGFIDCQAEGVLEH